MTTMTRTELHVGTLNFDALLADIPTPEGVREPDFYEDGRAYWLHPAGIVSMELERVPEALAALSQPHILHHEGDDHLHGAGWTRVHPSHYGVDVDSFHVHHGEVASHAAQTAWDIYVQAVSV